MKAFIIGVAAMVIVATGAGITFNSVQQSSGDRYSSGNARLGEPVQHQ
jgi:hypothetical protein